MRSAIAFALALLAVPAIADEKVRHPFNVSVPRTGIKRVIVDIPAGEFDLRNSSDGKSITAVGDVARDFSEYRDYDREQRIVNDMGVEIRVDGDEATISRTFGPRASGWTRKMTTEYRVRIELPRDVDVELETHFGEVHVEGEFGDVNVDLRAGEIHFRMPHDRVKELTASVRVGEVHADLGDERVSNEGVFPGATHFYNASGRSHVYLHTTAGEIHVTLR